MEIHTCLEQRLGKEWDYWISEYLIYPSIFFLQVVHWTIPRLREFVREDDLFWNDCEIHLPFFGSEFEEFDLRDGAPFSAKLFCV